MRVLLCAGLAALLAGCGGGSVSDPPPAPSPAPPPPPPPPPPVTYQVGGSISGLTAAGLSLANGGDSVSPAANAASFTFATALASGSSYTVTVSAQPAGQTCTVSNGAGTISAAVTNVQVSCTTNTYSIGGTISGLSAPGLKLANGIDTLTVASVAKSFTMPTKQATGVTYAVTVSAQPTGQTCSVASGSGTVGMTDIGNVTVTCSAVVAASWHSTVVGPGSGQLAKVASDPSASGFYVAWPQTAVTNSATPGVIGASHFTDATGWSSPVPIANTAITTGVSGLGFDNQGKGYAVFMYDAQTVASSRYTPGVGWTAEPIGNPPSKPVNLPPNTPVSSSTHTLGLAVFGDGAATGLVYEGFEAAPAGQPPYRDVNYWRVNATPGVDILSYGAAESELAMSPGGPTSYQYTDNGINYTTEWIWPASKSVFDDLVQAPTAHNYAANYSEIYSTQTSQTDQYGNHLYTMTISRGVELWVNDVAHPMQFVSDTSFDPIPTSALKSGGIAISDNGTALVGWSEFNGDGTVLTFYASRFDGTSWSIAQALGSWTGPYLPDGAVPVATAINGNGDGIVFYSAIVAGTTNGVVYAVRVDGTTGAFSAPVQVSIVGNYATAPWKALLDDRGNAYLMETRGVFRLAAGGSAFDATALGCVCDNNTGGQLALDRNGEPMAIWGASDGVHAGWYH